MRDYKELISDIRDADQANWKRLSLDAAAAIEELKAIAHSHCVAASSYWEELEELKAQLPKLGEWELIDGAEPMRWGCSRCKYMSWETSNYCPRCGAKMEVQDGRCT